MARAWPRITRPGGCCQVSDRDTLRPVEPDDQAPSHGYPVRPQSANHPLTWWRKVHRSGNGWAVQLPAPLLRFLGVAPGQHLYLALQSDGTVKLASVDQLAAHAGPLGVESERVAALVDENRRLRRRLAARRLAVFGQGYTQGWMRAVAVERQNRELLATSPARATVADPAGGKDAPLFER